MNLLTRNSPNYHLLKYLLFLLKHPAYMSYFQSLAQSLRISHSKGSTNVGTLFVWRRKHGQLPKRHAWLNLDDQQRKKKKTSSKYVRANPQMNSESPPPPLLPEINSLLANKPSGICRHFDRLNCYRRFRVTFCLNFQYLSNQESFWSQQTYLFTNPGGVMFRQT
jgi:hypothetical protein